MKLLIALSFLFLAACSNSNSGNQQQVTPTDSTSQAKASDPIVGEWIYSSPTNGQYNGTGIYLKLTDDYKITFTVLYFSDLYGRGPLPKLYSRIYSGLYKKSGDKIDAVYDHVTCNDLSSEKLDLYMSDGKLVIHSIDRDKTFGFVKKESLTDSPLVTREFVEDIDCNKFYAKSNKQDKRSIASSSLKSVFDLVK